MIKFRRAVLVIAVAALLARLILWALNFRYGYQQVLAGPFYFVPWADYYGIYIPQLRYLAAGVLPYTGFAYSYPPLFLYSMLPLYAAGGPLLPAGLILTADALTAVVICEIVSAKSTRYQGLLAGSAYALLPLALANEGYLALSSQPMLFFTILSVYFFDQKRIILSMVALGTAVMFKQEVLFVAFPMLYVALKSDFKSGSRGLGTFLAILALISLPFLLTAPSSYLSEISFGVFPGTHLPTSQLLSPWSGITFGTPCPGTCGVTPNLVQIQWDRFMDGLSVVLGWTILPLLSLSAVAIYATRHSRRAIYLSMAGLMIAFLYLFLLREHFTYAYYMLPVYALLMCAGIDKSSLAVPVLGSTLAAFVSYGSLQLVIALLTLLIVTGFASVKLVEKNALIAQEANRSGPIPVLLPKEQREHRSAESFGSANVISTKFRHAPSNAGWQLEVQSWPCQRGVPLAKQLIKAPSRDACHISFYQSE